MSAVRRRQIHEPYSASILKFLPCSQKTRRHFAVAASKPASPRHPPLPLSLTSPPPSPPCPSHKNTVMMCKGTLTLYKHYMMPMTVFVSALCVPVGVQDSSLIPDSSLKASTYRNDQYSPRYGRLGSERAWCTGQRWSQADYLQVDMGAEHALCAVATKGNPRVAVWTTRYKLAVSRDGVTFSFYQENNKTKVTEHREYVVSISCRVATVVSHGPAGNQHTCLQRSHLVYYPTCPSACG